MLLLHLRLCLEIMRITNIQKKELSDIFRESNLNILEFETSGQHKEFKVKFKHEYFSFSINIQKPDVYYLTIYPIDNTEGYSVSSNWAVTKNKFKDWINQIDNDLNTPNGWNTFQSSNYLNADFSDLEENFEETEKEQTRQNIQVLKEKINLIELPKESIDIINKKLDDLSIKLDVMSKFDWKSLFLGTVASLIMSLGIPPETNGILWEYIKISFSGLKIKG